MADDARPADDEAAMKARLAALGRDLGTTDRPVAASAASTSASGMGQAVNLGARVLSEFVAAIAVSAFIGWQLDRWLGSSPAALIVFVALGVAAAFWSVYRVATKPGSK